MSAYELFSPPYSTPTAANNLILNKIFLENRFDIYIPVYLTVKYGIVKDIPIDIDNEELLENIISPYDIIKIERLTKFLTFFCIHQKTLSGKF